MFEKGRIFAHANERLQIHYDKYYMPDPSRPGICRGEFGGDIAGGLRGRGPGPEEGVIMGDALSLP